MFWKIWSGRLAPRLARAARTPAHPPDARPPFRPQGGTALARSPAARSCPPQTDGTFHLCARRLARHVLPRTFVLRAGALPRRSRFALGHARARGLCPQSPDRLSRSAFVFADSSDARAKDALLCSTLTRPPAAFVAVSRQPPHAMAGGAATALVLRTARSSVASVLRSRSGRTICLHAHLRFALVLRTLLRWPRRLGLCAPSSLLCSPHGGHCPQAPDWLSQCPQMFRQPTV